MTQQIGSGQSKSLANRKITYFTRQQMFTRPSNCLLVSDYQTSVNFDRCYDDVIVRCKAETMDADQHEPQSPPLEMELNDDDAEEIIDLEGSQGIDGIEPLLLGRSRIYHCLSKQLKTNCIVQFHLVHMPILNLF